MTTPPREPPKPEDDAFEAFKVALRDIANRTHPLPAGLRPKPRRNA